MLVAATMLQKKLKNIPCLCLLSFIASLTSWPFWLYYASGSIRENSLISKMGIPMTGTGCGRISDILYIFSVFSALIGTVFIGISLAKNKDKEANPIVLNILSAILAWSAIFLVPGLARI